MMPRLFRSSNRTDRTPDRIYAHYIIEKELANRLKSSSRVERKTLYKDVYDDLYRRVPDHPQLTRKSDPEAAAISVERQLRLLKRYSHPDTIFLEIGPGDCSLSYAMCKYVKKVYAVDVSTEITKNTPSYNNYELIITDGTSIPVHDNTITLAYSNQLMEHLHIDDAKDQLTNIFTALAPGGLYICITPSRISGPHDVSLFYDKVSTGFHLYEYSYSDLSSMFKDAGFRKIWGIIGGRGYYISVPIQILKIIESSINLLPYFLRKIISRSFPVKYFLGITLIGEK